MINMIEFRKKFDELSGNLNQEAKEFVLKLMDEVEELQKAPTSKEVCDQLTEFFDTTVSFNGKSFCKEDGNDDEDELYYTCRELGTNRKLLTFKEDLPANLALLVSKFFNSKK